MLTLQEIQDCNITEKAIVERILAEAEKRLDGLIEKQNRIKQSILALLSLYLTILTALISAAFLVRSVYHELANFCIVAAVIFFFGLICLFRGLLSDEYGTPGSPPNRWLEKHYLEGDESTLSTILAFIAHDYDKRIKISYASNQRKVLWRDIGMDICIFGIPISAIVLFADPTPVRFLSLFQCHPVLMGAGFLVAGLILREFLVHLWSLLKPVIERNSIKD